MYGKIYGPILCSQFVPPSPSPTVSTCLFCLHLHCCPKKQVHHYHPSRFNIHAFKKQIVLKRHNKNQGQSTEQTVTEANSPYTTHIPTHSPIFFSDSLGSKGDREKYHLFYNKGKRTTQEGGLFLLCLYEQKESYSLQYFTSSLPRKRPVMSLFAKRAPSLLDNMVLFLQPESLPAETRDHDPVRR